MLLAQVAGGRAFASPPGFPVAGNWGLATGDWGLATGDWQLGTGNWGLADARPPATHALQIWAQPGASD